MGIISIKLSQIRKKEFIGNEKDSKGIIVIWVNQDCFKLQKIDYEGTVWVLNYNNPEPLLDHAIHMLERHGVKREDMEITETPKAKVGAIVVEIWPYELVVARVRTTRNDSFISGTEFNIELKLDENGNYIDYLWRKRKFKISLF